MTGIILAGGKSRRMGVNKSFLNIGKTTIIDSILKVYKEIFSEIIIVTNNPKDYEYCGVRLERDIIPDCGPLGGIFTGLKLAVNQYCFIAACDMPFIDEDIIRHISGVKGYDVVVPTIGGRYEPLFALYSKTCLAVLENQLLKRSLSVRDLYERCSVKELKSEELGREDIISLCFTNVNTPEDFSEALKLEQV